MNKPSARKTYHVRLTDEERKCPLGLTVAVNMRKKGYGESI
ncbi:MAG: hypothetical protein OXD29_09265 [Roseovarius sp.]|nr:hypothetical protein [Roseovarius sp.]MCY4208121.1 hypothetical protein [Roseovarius sp.]MCY4292141.1 hypothetical protein [Roseovarius sp.]